MSGLGGDVSVELVGIISGGVVVLNQLVALLRMKAEKWLESKNGGGVPRRVEHLIDEIRGLRSDMKVERIQDRAAAQEVVRILTESHVMLAEWQRKIDGGEFGCRISDEDLAAIRLCKYPNINK